MSEGLFALGGAAVVGILALLGIRNQNAAELRKALTFAQLSRRQDAYLQIVQYATSLSAWLSWVRMTIQGKNRGFEMPPVPEQTPFDQMLAEAATFGSDEVHAGVGAIWESLRAVFVLVSAPEPGPAASIQPMTGTPLLQALAEIDETENRATALTIRINRELRAPPD